jgi:hypothetical protein
MDLQTFITQTLVQIANGISDANVSLSTVGAVVNPSNVYPYDKPGSTVYGHIVPPNQTQLNRVVQLVNFDVAVIAAEGTGAKGGIGVVVGAFALGSQGSTTTNNSSHSRVQFAVPMALPQGKV